MSADQDQEQRSAACSGTEVPQARGVIRIGRGAVSDASGLSPGQTQLARRIGDSLSKAFERPRDKVVEDLEAAVTQKDYERAVRLWDDHPDAWFAARSPNRAMLDVLLRVPVDQLPATAAGRFVRVRAAIACHLKHFVLAMPDVDWLLARPDDLSPLWRFRWNLARAHAARERGHRELALHRIRDLVAAIPEEVPACEHASVVAVIVSLLPEGEPEAEELSQRARDLFLIGGERLGAARHRAWHARRIELLDPPRALALLDEARSLLETDDVESREIRAGSLHVTAAVLTGLNRISEARGASDAAIHELRRLVGLEKQLVDALGLRAEIEEHLDGPQGAAKYRDEAITLAKELDSSWLVAKHEISAAAKRSNEETLQLLERLDGTLKGPSERFWFHVLKAQYSSDIDAVLENAEAALALAPACTEARDNEYLVHWRIAQVLHQYDAAARAIDQYHRALQLAPWCFAVRNRLLHLLWQEQRWDAAIEILEGQISRLGKLPGLLLAYGQSLLEAGRLNEASEMLGEAIRAGGPNVGKAQELLILAIGRGAAPPKILPATPGDGISLDDLRRVLQNFAALVSTAPERVNRSEPRAQRNLCADGGHTFPCAQHGR